MSLLPILRWPDPRLATRCAPVPEITPEIETLAQDMLETMYAAPGRGLAAPQVGVLSRLFVMDTRWKEADPAPQVFVNPEIVARSEAEASHAEGCLSIPGITTQVTRPERVRMRWTDLEGTTREAWLEGFDAICAQHEFDHLDGIVTLDRLDAEARTEALAAYAGAQA